MNTSQPRGSGFGAGFLIVSVLAALALILLGVEGTYIVVNLRTAEDGLDAAAKAAALSLERVEENGYGVFTLRSTDGPQGLSALSAAQLQIETRGLDDRVRIDELLLVDDVVVLRSDIRLPSLVGRLIGLPAYEYALTTLAEVQP